MTAAYTVADDAASVILDKEELQIGYSDYNSDRFVIGNVCAFQHRQLRQHHQLGQQR